MEGHCLSTPEASEFSASLCALRRWHQAYTATFKGKRKIEVTDWNFLNFWLPNLFSTCYNKGEFLQVHTTNLSACGPILSPQNSQKVSARDYVFPFLCSFFFFSLSPLVHFNKPSNMCNLHHAAAAAKSLQSCPTPCNPIDGSPPGSPIPGILQARTLEWVAISLSNAWKWKVKVKSLSRVRLFATPWTAAHQAPPSLGFSRQEHWSGLPLRSPCTMLAVSISSS